MRTLLTIILSFFFSVNLLGQRNAKQQYAEQLLAEYNYGQASKVFEELAKSDLKKGNSSSANILQSARSYYLLGNNLKSAELYNLYAGDFSAEDAKYYLDVLTRNKDHKMITRKEEIFQEHSKDFSARDFLAYLKAMESDQRQIVGESHVNSDFGDFGVCSINGNVYFSSNRNSSTDVGLGSQGSVGTQMYLKGKDDKVTFVKELSLGLHNGPVAVDEQGYYYLTQTPHKGEMRGEKHIRVQILDDKFQPANISFEFNNPGYNVGHVSFSHDYKKMYFVSNMPGGVGGSDIYYSVKQSNGKWSPPVNFKEVNTPFDEMYPFEDKHGIFYFSSNGHVGLGGMDVFSYRRGKVENFGMPVNSSADDFALTFTQPRIGYFSSNRKGDIDRIYSFEQIVFNGVYEMLAMDDKYKRPIKGFTIRIVDEESPTDTLVFSTDEQGLAQIPISSGKNYILFTPEKFQPNDSIVLNTIDLRANEVIRQELSFVQDQYMTKIQLLDKDTKKPLTHVAGEFIDVLTGDTIHYYIDDSGYAEVALDDGKQYIVTARKKGYLNKKEVIWASSETMLDLQLEMDVIKKNVTFEVKDILYAFNDYKLLEDSKAQMEELVDFLKVNDNISVELSSHTDSRGSDEYNKTLSQKRAQSCVDYLVDKGVEQRRIVAKGYGESKLLNKCGNGVECSEEEHQANRRTEIKILQVK